MRADLKMKSIVTFIIAALLAGIEGKKFFFVTSFSLRGSHRFFYGEGRNFKDARVHQGRKGENADQINYNRRLSRRLLE